MRDVGPDLIPAVDDLLPLAHPPAAADHMAAFHATFWQAGDEFDVVPVMHRYLELSPWTSLAEAAISSTHLVPQLIDRGWPLLAEVAPAAAAVVTPLAWDPCPLVSALASTPQTFVHGNWKLDNLGTDSSGRTVLFDWELPGLGAPLSDLAWYLAINCRRLPQSKEAAIDAYRDVPGGGRGRHRALVGPAVGVEPARCAGAVRLGEGARRVRRRTGLVGRSSASAPTAEHCVLDGANLSSPRPRRRPR